MAGVNIWAYALQSIIDRNEVHNVPFVLLCVISLLVIFLVEVLQSGYLGRTQASKSVFVKYIVGSTYFLTVLTFLFTSVFLGISYIVFKQFYISFNLAQHVHRPKKLRVGTARAARNRLYSPLLQLRGAQNQRRERGMRATV